MTLIDNLHRELNRLVTPRGRAAAKTRPAFDFGGGPIICRKSRDGFSITTPDNRTLVQSTLSELRQWVADDYPQARFVRVAK